MKKPFILLACLLISATALGAGELLKAAKTGDLALAKRLLADGVSPDQLDPDDWRETTPLLAAIKSGHTALASLLMANQANCSATDFTGKNALIFAAQHDRSGLIGELVACGADLEITGGDGTRRTPLVWAVISGHEDTAMALVKHGARADIEWVHPVNDNRESLLTTIQEKGMDRLHGILKK